MLRNLAIWLLLPAMLLNGLWMVCNPGAIDSQELSRESADCIRICAALEAEFGRICFFLPGDHKTSITIIDFGAAIIPGDVVLPLVRTDDQLTAEPPSPYWNPNLSNPTPPPRV